MLEWPDSTLFEGLAEVADRWPDRPALVVGDDPLSHDSLLARSRRLSRGLADLGVGAGDVVATWLGNRPEWVVCQLACSRLGAAMVAVNTRYRSHELDYMLRDSRAGVIVTERSFLGTDYHDILAEVVPEVGESATLAFDPDSIPSLDAVVSLDPEPAYPALRDYATVAAGGETSVEPASDPSAPVAIFYTSGTTGDPKGCLQSSRSLLNHSYNDGAHLGVTADDATVAMAPFCGVYGYNTLFSALAHGAAIAVPTHFEPATVLDAIESQGVTYTTATGEMYRRLLDHDAFDRARVASVEVAAVGFLSKGFDEADFDRFEAEFGCPFVQPYGSSEANSMVFMGDPDDPPAERKRIGGPLVSEAIETKVVDPETRERLPPDEQGELAIRGYNVFLEYLGNPEATAAAVDDEGWFYSGDLCTIDEAGYHVFHARLDDAIRTRGFLVSPREIEQAIEQCPGVDRSQVVGVDHPRHGEVPVAFVIGEGGDAEAVRDALDDEVADYKVPAAIEFVEEFPVTEGPNGVKIRKTDLRERAASLVE